jgi:hypothetical protein
LYFAKLAVLKFVNADLEGLMGLDSFVQNIGDN